MQEKREKPRNGELYRHFKGNLYQVITTAVHSETREEMVVYQALYGAYGIFVRPLPMFMDTVDTVKYPDVKIPFRFTKVTEEELTGGCTGDTAKRQAAAEGNGAAQAADIPKAAAVVQERECCKEQPVSRQKGQDAFIRFLDADTYAKKLEILYEMKDKMDRRLLDSMAVSMDIILGGKDENQDYGLLMDHIKTRVRYDSSRLR